MAESCSRTHAHSSGALPARRGFLQLEHTVQPGYETTSLRVLQFNMLADGLSGLRADRGNFARLSVSGEELSWAHRQRLLMHEVMQYAPDVVCMQECDHYDDVFLNDMAERDYACMFAPKPASMCLEVSPRSDGCALFVHRSKLAVVHMEAFTYAIPVSDPSTGKHRICSQNQVALIATCHVTSSANSSAVSGGDGGGDACVVIATTHLKAAKTEEGEKVRLKEMEQLMERIEQIRRHLLISRGICAAVLIAGDLNASPECVGSVSPLVYPSIKTHALGLRSVYQDDALLPTCAGLTGSGIAKEGVYTTWKARRDGDEERVVKHCIDYILYSASRTRTSVEDPPRKTETTLCATALLDVFTEEEVGSRLLPSADYPSDHIAIAADLLLAWRTHA